MTYYNYEFTAFTEENLLSAGTNNGSSLGYGDVFTMPAEATVCITVCDNDSTLSGDGTTYWSDEQATDHYGQHASIEGPGGTELGNQGQIYVENYRWVSDQHGNWYVMMEIEQEGSNDDYFTFYTGGSYTVPPAGAVLTVGNQCDVTGDWLNYNCLDAGEKVVELGSIAGRLFDDADHDNTEWNSATHSYEEGIAGAKVELLDAHGNVVATTTTDEHGNYKFEDVSAGDYKVKFYNPDGTAFAHKDVGHYQTDSDANANGVTDTFHLGAGQHFTDVDAGVQDVTGSISGRLFDDADHDNTEWNSQTHSYEEGIAGATVELLDAHGNVVATTTTDDTGTYKFDSVAPGDYKVKFYNPDGTEFVHKDVGDYRADSDANSNGVTDLIHLGAKQDICEIDAGVKTSTGAISGTVFCDTDCDGLQQETIVVNGHDFTIEAEDMHSYGFNTVHGSHASGGELVKIAHAGAHGALSTVFDGKDGAYTFSLFAQDEADGCSTIQVKVNGHVVDTIVLNQQTDGWGSDNDGFSEFTIDHLQLKTGDVIELCVDADSYEWARIDKIELVGKDSVTTIEEPVKEGVVVKLLDAHGVVVDTTETDADGNYSFDNVPVGNYRVMGVAPDGTEFTIKDAGHDDSIDSDVDSTGTSDLIHVTAGSSTDIDLGVCEKELGSVSGRYFHDGNRDGVETDFDGNFEAGVAGATVWLVLQGTGVVASTTTDADGNYTFGDLEAGTYSVRFEDPADVAGAEDKSFIDADQGDDAIDSDVVSVDGAGDGNTATFTLAEGENKTDIDAGVNQAFMVCDDPDAVLIDFEGFAAGTVIDDEYAANGVTISAQRATNNDAANNAMVFDSFNPTGGDTDLKTASQGNLLIVSEDNDSTDPDDAIGGVVTFDFDNPSRVFDLKVVDTEEGGTVELFDAAGNSLGIIDLPNLADGGIAQVMIDAEGVSQMVVTLNGSGAIDDICIVPGEPPLGSLSGRYFLDANRDGLDNDGVNGIGGISVELLDETGAGTDRFTTTAADGSYSFSDLAPGDYGVKFTDPDTGRELTAQNEGTDDTIDSDAGDVGGGMSQITGITVASGIDTANNDAGVVIKAGAISGTYFCDENRDDVDNGASAGDKDVAFKTVTLLNADGTAATDIDGNPVDPVQTDEFGNYSFTNLAPGDYKVAFEAEVGKNFVAPNVGNAANDSDVLDQNGQTGMITVAAGETVTDIDAGVATLPGGISGRYFFDTNKDNIDNDGVNGVVNVTVQLLDSTGNPATDIDGNAIASVPTNPDGSYSFANLAPGTYSVKFTDTVTGAELVTPDQGGDDENDSDATDLGGGMSQIDGIVVIADTVTADNDAGVKDPGTASIGDTVFLDANGDGFLSAGEVGVDDVTVNLLDGTGTLIDTATTMNGGMYLFDGLDAGDYQIEFAPADTFEFTTQDATPSAGNDDANDSDANVTTGRTGVYTLEIGDDNLTVDAGLVFANLDPEPVNDEGKTCADEELTIDVLDNDTDPDGGTLTITAVDGQAITEGGPAIETSQGTFVKLVGGQLVFDGEAAYGYLDINEEETETISYTVDDGQGGWATASVDVTFCGDANSLASLAESFNTLPGTQVSFNVLDIPNPADLADLYTLDLLSSTNDDLELGLYGNAYCLDGTQDITLGVVTQGNAFVATEANVAAVAPSTNAANIDSVNWILNQDWSTIDNGDGNGKTFTDLEVQEAIWLLMNNQTFIINQFTAPELTDNQNGVRDGVEAGTLENAQDIFEFALAQDGYTPGDGDIVALIIEPTDPAEQDQPFIIGVEFDAIDCLCLDDMILPPPPPGGGGGF